MSGFTQTPHYNLYKPTAGADKDLWGGHLNSNADVIDSTLYSNANTAAGALPRTGGTLTGALTLSADAVASMQPVTLQQMTGALPVAANTAPPMNGVANVGTSALYARQDHVHASDTSRLALNGGTLTGALTLAADPTGSMQPVTLQYYTANLPVVPAASSSIPAMDAGAGFAGTGTNFARGDHVHPSDTSRAPVANPVFTAGLFEHAVAMGAGSAIDLNAASVFSKTVTGATTFTVSNTPASGTFASFILDLTNGGAGAITWWANLRWAGGAAPILTGAGRDVLGFYTWDAGANWNGLMLGKGMA